MDKLTVTSIPSEATLGSSLASQTILLKSYLPTGSYDFRIDPSLDCFPLPSFCSFFRRPGVIYAVHARRTTRRCKTGMPLTVSVTLTRYRLRHRVRKGIYIAHREVTPCTFHSNDSPAKCPRFPVAAVRLDKFAVTSIPSEATLFSSLAPSQTSLYSQIFVFTDGEVIISDRSLDCFPLPLFPFFLLFALFLDLLL